MLKIILHFPRQLHVSNTLLNTFRFFYYSSVTIVVNRIFELLFLAANDNRTTSSAQTTSSGLVESTMKLRLHEIFNLQTTWIRTVQLRQVRFLEKMCRMEFRLEFQIYVVMTMLQKLMYLFPIVDLYVFSETKAFGHIAGKMQDFSLQIQQRLF